MCSIMLLSTDAVVVRLNMCIMLLMSLFLSLVFLVDPADIGMIPVKE